MANGEFERNLLRAILATQWTALSIAASREFYGKNYFSLSVAEKAAVDKLVLEQVGQNYQAVTAQWLAGTTTSPLAPGFQVPAKTTEKKE